MFVRDLLPCMYVLEFYLRRTYLQGRTHVLAGTVARTCLEDAVALPLFPQTFASVPANVCIRSRKRLQPPLQTFATAIANVCGEKNLFLPCFSADAESFDI